MSFDWQKSLRRSTGEVTSRPPFRNVVRGSIPEEQKRQKSDFWPMFRRVARPRTQRVLSDIREDDENRMLKNAAGRKNSRKSSRPSLADITNDLNDVTDHAILEDEEVFEVKEFKRKAKGVKAPRKKDQSFLLAIPSRSSTSSRTPSPRRVSDSLPEGVICLDVDDGTENSYANDTYGYLRGLEESFELDNCKWKGFKRAEKRRHSRAILLDWIIEAVHYFRASQECLYQVVHIIDRYLSKHEVEGSRIQLVGLAAILIGTKLEEYFFSDIDQLQVLCKRAYTAKDIVSMEMDILAALSFKAYSVDPMAFVNRCIRAALREDDVVFYEATIFFMDSIICSEDYWAFKPSRKAAAATYAAINLVPGPEDGGWTPTLRYYSGYSVDQIALMSRQMIDLLWKASSGDLQDGECGIISKYKSISRHKGFINSVHCSVDNVEEAIKRINHGG